ncbi:MAG: copper chaperone PCu(A)C [Pseudonocardia sp.]
MSRFARSRPSRVATGVGAVVAALLLAGCGAGQLTGTSTQGSSTGGANAGAGDIVVRDAEIEFGTGVPAAIVYPAGATAPLQMRIVNEGGTADTLVSASSPFADSVQISGATVVPGGQAVVVGSSAVAMPGIQVAQIQLVGLRQELRAGLTYPVVLEFAGAGPIELTVPIDNPTTPREPAAE